MRDVEFRAGQLVEENRSLSTQCSLLADVLSMLRCGEGLECDEFGTPMLADESISRLLHEAGDRLLSPSSLSAATAQRRQALEKLLLETGHVADVALAREERELVSTTDVRLLKLQMSRAESNLRIVAHELLRLHFSTNVHSSISIENREESESLTEQQSEICSSLEVKCTLTEAFLRDCAGLPENGPSSTDAVEGVHDQILGSEDILWSSEDAQRECFDKMLSREKELEEIVVQLSGKLSEERDYSKRMDAELLHEVSSRFILFFLFVSCWLNLLFPLLLLSPFILLYFVTVTQICSTALFFL